MMGRYDLRKGDGILGYLGGLGGPLVARATDESGSVSSHAGLLCT